MTATETNSAPRQPEACTLGIDLGGTKIAALAYDPVSETVLARHTVPTTRTGADAVIAQIAEAARQVAVQAGISLDQVGGVGIGVPATLDYALGQTLMMPNIPGEWWNKPVAPQVGAALGCPAWLINDARAFTLAEATLGAGRGAQTVVCFTFGTGIGGGIFIDGKVHMGLMGTAGEVGHHTIAWDGLPDGSGNRGGLEGLCSGPAIAAMGAKAVMQGVNTRIRDLVSGDLNAITPRIIQQAAAAGDETAQGILDRAGEYLGAALANMAILIAPEVIVIGGGMANLGDAIMQPTLRAFRERVRHFPFETMRVVMASLGDDAGAIGAALWAAQKAG